MKFRFKDDVNSRNSENSRESTMKSSLHKSGYRILLFATIAILLVFGTVTTWAQNSVIAVRNTLSGRVTSQLGTGQLGTGQLGTGQLGTGQLGTGQLGTGEKGTGEKGTSLGTAAIQDAPGTRDQFGRSFYSDPKRLRRRAGCHGNFDCSLPWKEQRWSNRHG